MEGWYKYIISTVCIIGWFLWFLVLVFISPDDLGVFSVILFFVTIGFALFASFLLILYYLKVKLLKRGPVFKEFNIIFKQSAILTFFIIFVLVLLHNRSLNMLNLLLLVILSILINMFFVFNYGKKFNKTT